MHFPQVDKQPHQQTRPVLLSVASLASLNVPAARGDVRSCSATDSAHTILLAKKVHEETAHCALIAPATLAHEQQCANSTDHESFGREAAEMGR